MHNQSWALSRRVLIFALLTLSLSTIALAQGNSNDQKPWGDRKESAISRLGARLPEVAAKFNMSPGELVRALRSDSSLWLSKNEQLVYIEESPAPTGGAQSSSSVSVAAGPVPYDQTFKLHSLPGSNRVIYLDFDGHTTTNTLWNYYYSPAKTWTDPLVTAPFDLDGVPASFSTTEQDRIQYIWKRVAEEFAPFGVDVTTEYPGSEDALKYTGSTDATWGMRVIIGPEITGFFDTSGGVAWVGSFKWDANSTAYSNNGTGTPCYVFTSNLASGSEKYTADAIAHEVGHTLGLQHDGVKDAACTTITEYYAGHSNWAPIMGVGYNKAVTQWSKGEYTMANNTQDDLAVITSSYGVSYRADDHGNAWNDTVKPATSLTVSGTAVSGKGIIETGADVDVFKFQTGGGNVTFNITGNTSDSNLDVQAKLFDSNGTQVLLNNPTTLSASFTTNLAAGFYYLAIEGVGAGDAVTSYNDYGSLGEFNISGTIVAVAPNQAPTAAAAGTPTTGVAPLTVAFSSAGSTDTDGSIASYSWNFGNGSTATTANPSTTYNTAGTFTATLTVTDNGGLTNSKTVTITVTAATVNAPSALMATATSSSQINLSWVDGSSNETGFKVERSLNNSTWAEVATLGANVTAYSDTTGLSASTQYYYRVRANNGTVFSNYSNVAYATTQASTNLVTAAIHVGDIDHSRSTNSRTGTWNAMVTITAHSATHGILAGATVTGTWNNGTAVTCKTGSKGTCSISRSGQTATSVTFAVTNVTLSGYSYSAALNHDPDGSSNGTSVTIAKP